jgi:hypothetical protein
MAVDAVEEADLKLLKWNFIRTVWSWLCAGLEEIFRGCGQGEQALA